MSAKSSSVCGTFCRASLRLHPIRISDLQTDERVVKLEDCPRSGNVFQGLSQTLTPGKGNSQYLVQADHGRLFHIGLLQFVALFLATS